MTNTPDDPDVQYHDETDLPGEGTPEPASDRPAEPDSDGGLDHEETAS